ncbi:hypothetical protein [Streptomyces sp. NPDC090994]|uniref:hypothetical protein n=1 Tax=Streptomyces sp. NPDC090994 TaxID=3365969 RepID=UPI00382677D6
MLNRIRRAVSLARARYFRKGRHRRASTPSWDVAVMSPALAARQAAVPKRVPATSDRFPLLRGEENALVRPYVLATEERARRRSVIVAPRLSAEAWSALAGAH